MITHTYSLHAASYNDGQQLTSLRIVCVIEQGSLPQPCMFECKPYEANARGPKQQNADAHQKHIASANADTTELFLTQSDA